MTEQKNIVEIVRRRLADGRTIADSDVRRLVTKIDQLLTALKAAKINLDEGTYTEAAKDIIAEALEDGQ